MYPEKYYTGHGASRFIYYPESATFESPSQKIDSGSMHFTPPDNCSVCYLHHRIEKQAVEREIEGGIVVHGKRYHLNDFVLYRSSDPKEPANLGYITEISVPVRQRRTTLTLLTIRKVGRVSALKNVVPIGQFRHEVSIFFHLDVNR